MAFVGRVLADEVEGAVGSTLYGTCGTAASTAEKTVSITGLDTLLPGLTIHVKFTNSNTAETPTITIQGTSVSKVPLYRYGATKPGQTAETSWAAGAVVSLTYDGTSWYMNDWMNTNDNTTYNDATQQVHGLMSTADKTKLDGFDIKAFSSIVIPGGLVADDGGWETDNTYTDYGFKAVLTCTGVTAGHVPAVTFLPADLDAYYICPVATSGDGTVTVYCGIMPTSDLTVQSITAIKYTGGGS